MVLFLSSPYSGTDEQKAERLQMLEICAVTQINKGEVPISPVLMGHPLVGKYELPDDFKYWKHYCLSLLQKSDKMIVIQCEGWENSEGVQSEIQYANEYLIPIEYYNPYTKEDT